MKPQRLRVWDAKQYLRQLPERMGIELLKEVMKMEPQYDNNGWTTKVGTEFTERIAAVGKTITVTNESKRYATIEWKYHYRNYRVQGGGWDVEVSERSESRVMKRWSGYGFESYQGGKPVTGKSADERLRTITGIKATLADLGFDLPDRVAERLFLKRIERERELTLYGKPDFEITLVLLNAEENAAAELGIKVSTLDYISQREWFREISDTQPEPVILVDGRDSNSELARITSQLEGNIQEMLTARPKSLNFDLLTFSRHPTAKARSGVGFLR
jgi:hypothetical protein